jgi:hypothetical protein
MPFKIQNKGVLNQARRDAFFFCDNGRNCSEPYAMRMVFFLKQKQDTTLK